MITRETLETLATRHRTGVFPNIVREYIQHVFLAALYTFPGAEKLLFKGGTALRVIYGSPRFSEDLDFSIAGIEQSTIKSFVEEIFVSVLAHIAKAGIQVELGPKSGATTGGYFGVAMFRVMGFAPVNVEINISSRSVRNLKGEADSVSSEFVPTYTLIHLPQEALVEEKVFGALRARKKPRDFYDLYYIMRRGMLTADQKKRLSKVRADIIADAQEVKFRSELGVFLPADQQAIIRDFPGVLERELSRQ